jgi:Winged helix-turn-helix DNA-binding
MQEQPLELRGMAQQAHISDLSRFRRIAAKVHSSYIEQLDYRRERQVYLLTNGKRTIAQIATLLAIPPLNVAYMMKRLLEQGYVEYVPFDEEEMSRAI